MPSPFYSASVVLFQLHGGMVSHMQALATPSSNNVNNTWILTTESISVLADFSPHSKAKANYKKAKKSQEEWHIFNWYK